MKTPSLTDHPYQLTLALRRVAARERAARRPRRLGLLRRLFTPHCEREHTAVIDGLTIHSNVPN